MKVMIDIFLEKINGNNGRFTQIFICRKKFLSDVHQKCAHHRVDQALMTDCHKALFTRNEELELVMTVMKITSKVTLTHFD